MDVCPSWSSIRMEEQHSRSEDATSSWQRIRTFLLIFFSFLFVEKMPVRRRRRFFSLRSDEQINAAAAATATSTSTATTWIRIAREKKRIKQCLSPTLFLCFCLSFIICSISLCLFCSMCACACVYIYLSILYSSIYCILRFLLVSFFFFFVYLYFERKTKQTITENRTCPFSRLTVRWDIWKWHWSPSYSNHSNIVDGRAQLLFQSTE